MENKVAEFKEFLAVEALECFRKMVLTTAATVRALDSEDLVEKLRAATAGAKAIAEAEVWRKVLGGFERIVEGKQEEVKSE